MYVDRIFGFSLSSEYLMKHLSRLIIALHIIIRKFRKKQMNNSKLRDFFSLSLSIACTNSSILITIYSSRAFFFAVSRLFEIFFFCCSNNTAAITDYKVFIKLYLAFILFHIFCLSNY